MKNYGLTYKGWKKWREEEDEKDKKIEEAREIIEEIKNFIHGHKYRNPIDENERGYNRGIDRAIMIIDDDFLF